jgi:hypothetical protein
MSGGDPRTVLEQYEALRREATETPLGGSRGHGLALCLTRGLPGWLAALTALTALRRPPPAAGRGAAPPRADAGVVPRQNDVGPPFVGSQTLQGSQPTQD